MDRSRGFSGFAPCSFFLLFLQIFALKRASNLTLRHIGVCARPT